MAIISQRVPTMRMEASFPSVLNEPLTIRTYDPELDDVRSILGDVCEWLEPHAEFVVSGFGQDRWPTDVRTDLLVLLEQLPGALHTLASGAPFEIDFYEQGIQRKVVFTPAEDAYLAKCLSYGTWEPNPAVERIERDSLEAMLVMLREQFMRLLRMASPDLAEHPWIQSWLRGEFQF